MIYGFTSDYFEFPSCETYGIYIKGLPCYRCVKSQISLQNTSGRTGREKEKAVEVLIESGYRFLDLKKYEDAGEEFERALRLFPENKEAERALVWSKTLNCENTRQDCEAAIDLLRLYLKENSDLDLLGYQKIIEDYLEK